MRRERGTPSNIPQQWGERLHARTPTHDHNAAAPPPATRQKTLSLLTEKDSLMFFERHF